MLLAVTGQPGKEWASLTEIAEFLQIRHHGAVGLANRCERAGYIQRTPDPVDRRQVRVTLTPKGEELLSRISERNLQELVAFQSALKNLLPFEDS